ncbi:glycosyltransferase family 4 protein [Patescibacteria group bacterium]
MKIGIDARFYGIVGPGRYTKSVIQHLEKVDSENEYVIFLEKEGFKNYHPKSKNFKKVLANYSWYSFEEQTSFLLTVVRQKLDLYYVPHFNIPVLYPGKIVTAIPDMTMHKHSTRFSTTLPQWYFFIKKFVYKLVFWWAVCRSYKVIVPSETVIKEFLTYLKFPKEKYVLAYEGVDPDYTKPHSDPEKVLKKYNIEGDFILYVGSMYAHKNVPNMLEMYKELREKYNFKAKFVLVSKKDLFSQEIFDKVKNENIEGIVMPAFQDSSIPNERKIVITDEEVTALRQKAKVYVIAALTEGFSLTAMEGMVHGLPAVISDIDCHREVYGDSALYFDPEDPSDMAAKVNEMFTNSNLRDAYIKKGYKLLKKYDWIKTAKITLGVFKNAVKK